MMKLTSKKSKNVTASEKALVVKMARRCMRELSKKEYELGKFDRPLHIDVKHKGQRSYGGKRRISIDLWEIRRNYTTALEYKSYADDPVIGTIKNCTPELALFATVAHEIAHHVQYAYCPRIRRFDGQWRKPHGDAFKRIYRYLRQSLINPEQLAHLAELDSLKSCGQTDSASSLQSAA
jgi:hypothetical protein